MTLIIDRGFTIQKTTEERLTELESWIEYLFEQRDAGKMTAHDMSYEVATAGYERQALLKVKAARQRQLNDLGQPADLPKLKQVVGV